MINTIYIDFHGVLTDGKLNITSDGKTLFESCHVRDTAAIRELIARGYLVYIVTASSSPIIDAYCEKVGCLKINARDKSGLPGEYIAVGDSAFDISMLKNAARAFAPADAVKAVKELPNVELTCAKGGEGVMEEILNELIAK